MLLAGLPKWLTDMASKTQEYQARQFQWASEYAKNPRYPAHLALYQVWLLNCVAMGVTPTHYWRCPNTGEWFTLKGALQAFIGGQEKLIPISPRDAIALSKEIIFSYEDILIGLTDDLSPTLANLVP